MYSASTIKKLRKEKGMTQQQLADYLHMDRSTYAYYELGRTKPTIEFIIDLSRLYNVSLNTLLGEQPIEEAHDYSGMLFSQLNRDEQKLVILFRSLRPEQRETMLAQAEALVQEDVLCTT